MEYYGGIEAGGTKFVCAVAERPDGPLVSQITFPTTTPQETLARSIAFFKEYRLRALGIGTFGPVDLNPGSPTYGYITTTPKPKWQHTDLIGPLRQALGVPIGLDTDVNAAALAEYIYGQHEPLDSLAYFTVGTGIGGGIVIRGQPVHGLVHPEIGHIRVDHHPEDTFRGICPYHGDCLEGMASGLALQARCGASAAGLESDHPVWIMEAFYLAQLVSTILYVVSPTRIVLGGGVMHQAHLYPTIRHKLGELVNGYMDCLKVPGTLERVIRAPQLGDTAGIRGALGLAVRSVL